MPHPACSRPKVPVVDELVEIADRAVIYRTAYNVEEICDGPSLEPSEKESLSPSWHHADMA
jgi:hypothetical protein